MICESRLAMVLSFALRMLTDLSLPWLSLPYNRMEPSFSRMTLLTSKAMPLAVVAMMGCSGAMPNPRLLPMNSPSLETMSLVSA